MKLSLVELAPVTPGRDKTHALEQAVGAARHAEQLGYLRIWYAEHHNTAGFASADPGLLIAMAARETSRIRVGSGAVLLNHYSPLRVAETFLQLEAQAPGRVDLGLGRATAGPIVDLALQRDRGTRPVDDYAAQIEEILAYFCRAFPADYPLAAIDPTLGIPTRPDVWLLGSSGNSANLAGALGLGYAFAGFINPRGSIPALARYRAAATRDADRGGARTILAVNCVVADTDDEAHRLTWYARAYFQRLSTHGVQVGLPTMAETEKELSSRLKDEPSVIVDGQWPRQLGGSPATVRSQLAIMAEVSGADEIMVQDMLPDPEIRARSRELLAQSIGITTPTPP